MFNEEEKNRIFNQVMNIWIKPEIENRIKDGRLKKGTEIRRMQIIFTLGESPEIRFNENVVITALTKLNGNISKIKGEEVRRSDIEKIEKFIVDCPSDSGHITLFRFLDSWIFIFDARYNAEKVKRTLKISKNFYNSAKNDLENNRLIPFYENCWNSAELSAICHMLRIGERVEGHGILVKNFFEWSELKNVNKKHAEALSRLKELRGSRYSLSTDFENENPKEFLEIAKGMIEEAEKLIED